MLSAKHVRVTSPANPFTAESHFAVQSEPPLPPPPPPPLLPLPIAAISQVPDGRNRRHGTHHSTVDAVYNGDMVPLLGQSGGGGWRGRGLGEGEGGGGHSTVDAVYNGHRVPLLVQSGGGGCGGGGWGRGAGITQLLLQSPMGTGSPCLGNLGWGWGVGERGGDHSTVAAVSNGDRFPLLRQSWLGVGWGRGAGITQLLLQSPMGTGSPCLGNLGWGWGGGEGRGSLNCCCSLQWGQVPLA